jgi:hypothetical protein
MAVSTRRSRPTIHLEDQAFVVGVSEDSTSKARVVCVKFDQTRVPPLAWWFWLSVAFQKWDEISRIKLRTTRFGTAGQPSEMRNPGPRLGRCIERPSSKKACNTDCQHIQEDQQLSISYPIVQCLHDSRPLNRSVGNGLLSGHSAQIEARHLQSNRSR